MRKIVIPTDFSDNAYNALQFSVKLFQDEQNEIFLLHAYAEEIYSLEADRSATEIEDIKNEIHLNAVENLEQMEERLKDSFPNLRHRIKSIAAYGLLIDEVNELVNTENADIIVMGTRGKTNDRDVTFGTNTLQVLRYVQCPVLMIPEGFTFSGLANILFPTNFLIPYKSRELKLLADTARYYGSTLHSLYISKFPAHSLRQQENRKYFKKFLKKLKNEYHQIAENDKVSAIMDQISRLKIDLLVMVNSRHTYLEDILLESTITKMGLQPKIPFLVLQNYNRVGE